MKSLIFKDWGIRAMLAGRKTMTRRLMKPQTHIGIDNIEWRTDIVIGMNEPEIPGWAMMRNGIIEGIAECPFDVGDVFCAKEIYALLCDEPYGNMKDKDKIVYRATEPHNHGCLLKWESPMFMPEKYARIFRKITNIKAERLQDISEEDAQEEGVEFYCDLVGITHRDAFMMCMIDIYGLTVWDANPWVWVYEFEKEG